MELKVLNNTLTAYSGRWETRLELPVEAEILIPDYLPAVFKIVKCRLEPVVLHNDLTGARWQGDGYLRCTVFYQSDEAGARLWRTEQKVRFEKTAELPAGRYAPGPAALGGETEYCNCRAVSERRIDIRGAYTLSVAALALEEQELPASLSGCGIEQRPLTLCGVTPAVAAEKLYTAQTTLPLPGDGEKPLMPKRVGDAVLTGAQVQHLPVPQPPEISGRHGAAHVIVRADRVDPLEGGHGRHVPQQDGGSPPGVAAQQLLGGDAGADQQNAVHPVAHQKVKQGVDFSVSCPAAAQHDLIAPLLGVPLQMQRQGGVEGTGEIRQDDAQHVGPAGHQTSGQKIGAVALLPADLKHLLPGLRVDLRRVVQGPGDGGDRHSGQPGDILDGDAGHETHLHPAGVRKMRFLN